MTGAGRIVALLVLACLAGCAARSISARETWILPLSAENADQVCVIVMEYPGRRCTTVGEIRAYVRSVKAD